jgi:hypothetical protein
MEKIGKKKKVLIIEQKGEDPIYTIVEEGDGQDNHTSISYDFMQDETVVYAFNTNIELGRINGEANDNQISRWIKKNLSLKTITDDSEFLKNKEIEFQQFLKKLEK